MSKYYLEKNYEKLNKIVDLNKYIEKHLWKVEEFRKKYLDKIILKVCDNILCNYKINFYKNIEWDIDEEKYLNYLKKITSFILENFENIESVENIKKLHLYIVSELKTSEKIKKEDIWVFRNVSKHMSWMSKSWKIIKRWLTGPKYISKEYKKILEYLQEKITNWKDKEKFDAIITFIFYNLFVIHPFDNGNSKVFYLLLDILLLKNNFFPLLIRKKEFYPRFLESFKSYTPNYNLEELKYNIYDDIIYIYSHYQI